MATGDRFLDSELGDGSDGGEARDGIWKNNGSWLESFGGGAKGGPPAWAGFFQQQEFGPILRADEASGDDFRVIEDEKIFWGEKRGQITDRSIVHFSGRSVNMEEAGRVPRMGGGGGDPIRGDGNREEFL